jgi:hypothetical protein
MKPLHRNLLIASSLYRASALLTVVAYVLYDAGGGAFPELLIIALTLLVAYLIRIGFRWLKWALLVIEIAYMPFFVMALMEPWAGRIGMNVMSIVVDLLQLIALVFLFLPRKEEPELEEEDDQPADT